jgi:transposase
MLPHHAPAPQSTAAGNPASPPTPVGVGIDTARYGHYAAFLRDDHQPAAPELAFAEDAGGYAQLRQRLEGIAQRHPAVAFHIRLDAAGQYADNLRHFLQDLAGAAGAAGAPAPFAHARFTLSCGDPQRNKNYRAALFGARKSDPVEARAAAHFALSQRPTSDKPLSPELRTLRQVAGRLQAVVRQRTRLVNQFHQLLVLTFPELALLVKDVTTGWVLELLRRYPTAPLLAAATPADLDAIPYLPDDRIEPLLSRARASVASLTDPALAELVRDHVRQLRDVQARQKRLESTLAECYGRLPVKNHLDTIKGFGAVTAAVLTAAIVDIERFAEPAKLDAYFGVVPIEVGSGAERDGQPRGPKRYAMSRRGNDLVRRYLWMAALSAVQHNPAVRALFARLARRRPERKAAALGQCMRKLLHLAFAVWKSGKPFDPNHYPWETPAHVEQGSGVRGQESDVAASDNALSRQDRAAGHKPDEPAEKVVTAARSIPRAPLAPAAGEHGAVDFAHVKRQLTMAQVTDHLGLKLRGTGPQRRGACPIHRGDGRGRTFNVNLEQHVFQCFEATCGARGDVIDLWASVNGLSLRDAALDLVRTFDLDATPPGTGKRNG